MSTPDKIPDEEALFEAAMELPDPAARAAFLQKNCGDDTALRKRLEGLLDAVSGADRFFAESHTALSTLIPEAVRNEPPRSNAPAVLPGSELIGKQIGRYRLLELLGEGGWGVVYLAEQQEPVQRRVALKIIRVGMETSTIITRFETERQTLAMMDHPNIARVFDAGETDRGFPYFVMEWVQGEKITEYCDRNHLDLESRLKLFVQICHAIQHAHQKGVIHRDIKPSNIMVTMVDDLPVPKVIDFGIAKATQVTLSDKPAGTAFVQLIGTPAYMSPEQAELRWMDVDTRSDIYSLGVLLYELLVGCTPFDPKQLTKSGLNEMRRILREVEPPRPSVRLANLSPDERGARAQERHCEPARLQTLLEGDLDWIVTKTLEKERRQRYETANGLAMDIMRHLNHETVTARPPTWMYRTQKAVRRNRLLFAAGTAVAIALIGGMGTSTWLLLKEREAHKRAVEAERQQARLRHEAETREKITQATLLINQERYPEVDELLRKLDITEPTVEGAAAVRVLGEWHAIEGRYRQASELFRLLMSLDALDGWDVQSLDPLRLGPVLVLGGDTAAYGKFREEVLASFLANPRPASDRVIKACMLTPLDAGLLEKLSPLTELSALQMREAEANGDAFQSAWISMSMAIWDYRRGDLARAEHWAQRCLASPDFNAPRAATAHAVLALSLQKRGLTQEARSETVKARDLIEGRARIPQGRGTPVQGFWFDWAFARILLRELDTAGNEPKP